jgi:hypothetical protein
MTQAVSVRVTGDSLTLILDDGRNLSVPLDWYPRLLHATASERKNWRLIAKGKGIHWEDIEEDISVAGLLAGRSSGESQTSFKRWMASRWNNRPSHGSRGN